MLIENLNVLVGAILFVVALTVFLIERQISGYRIRKKITESLMLNKLPIRSTRINKSNIWVTTTLFQTLSKFSTSNNIFDRQKLSLKLIRAGLYGDSANIIYLGTKSALTIGLPVMGLILLTLLFPEQNLSAFIIYLVCLAGAGYLLPDLYIKYRTGHRKHKNQDVIGDFVDLLVVCVEAGLGLDAAFNKIQTEFSVTNPIFAQELYITNLEIRAGSGRNIGLKNLALRVDLDDLRNLVGMLVQIDQFGTSVADSLRIHSKLVRVSRMQRAERIAAKLPIKMLIPMVLCIFPGFLVIILGPAIIQMMSLR